MNTLAALSKNKIRSCIALAAVSLLAAGITPSAASADTPLLPPAPTLFLQTGSGGGGHNMVQVVNSDPSHVRVGGNVQLNTFAAPTVSPVNYALAEGFSCTGCQTMAVALQVDVIGRNVSNFQPQNFAVAVNYSCDHCVAYADAVQCVFQVDAPTQVPPGVREFVAAMRTTLSTMQADPTLTLTSAEAQIAGVVAEYDTLLNQLSAPDACQTTSGNMP